MSLQQDERDGIISKTQGGGEREKHIAEEEQCSLLISSQGESDENTLTGIQDFSEEKIWSLQDLQASCHQIINEEEAPIRKRLKSEEIEVNNSATSEKCTFEQLNSKQTFNPSKDILQSEHLPNGKSNKSSTKKRKESLKIETSTFSNENHTKSEKVTQIKDNLKEDSLSNTNNNSFGKKVNQSDNMGVKIKSRPEDYVRLNEYSNVAGNDDTSTVKCDAKDEQNLLPGVDMKLWLNGYVKILLEHLNKYGVCALDNFLGEEKGIKVLNEICMLQQNDLFKDGQVMSGGGNSEPNIRSDKISWTDGYSPQNSPNLRILIKLLDSIVMTANRVKNNGELAKYRLNCRTRIMVACYPGGGSRYIKHVDNANGDGRVVTAIYYLNKHWNSKVDGGSLKIYSQLTKGRVMQVDPIFDRVVFFWSDSRNPHEVLPSNRPRYAVTVWYLDDKEKQEYITRQKQQSSQVSDDFNTHTPAPVTKPVTTSSPAQGHSTHTDNIKQSA